MPVKLSKRLMALRDAVPTEYAEIWDCCCDHGLLGMALAEKFPNSLLHYVDQVPGITAALEKNLQTHQQARWRVHTQNAADICLNNTELNLIMLAGIGGKTCIELIQAIEQKHSTQERHYLLSPNYQLFDLRVFLIQSGFSLLAETLVTDNQRHNEILLVSNITGEQKISATGNFWQPHQTEHQDYMRRLLLHYRHKTSDAPILQAYQACAANHQLPQ